MLARARAWMSWKMAPSEVKQLAGDSGDFLVQVLEGARLGRSTMARPGTVQLLDAYSKMPWLRAVVHKVAHSVGMTTWRLFVARQSGANRTLRVAKYQFGARETRQRLIKQDVRGGEVEVEEILDHPLLTLLNSGSEAFPGITNMRMMQTYFDLVGEAAQLKDRGLLRNETSGNRIVTGLVNVPPHWIRSLPSPGNPFYGIQFGRAGKVEPVPAEDVIFYRDPNPADPYGRGTGMAGVLGDELQANEAASRTIRSRLENNAIPPFIAMPEKDDQTMSRPKLERVREDWQRRLRGPSKSGFVHFLLSRFKFEKLAHTFEELDLIPLLQNQRDTIIQVYGVPPEIFGILTSSNRATIEAAEFLMGKFVVTPRLEFIRSVLQQMLVPEFDDRLILDFESPASGDKEFESKVMTDHSWAFKANEIRERAGQPSLGEEGEVFAVPINVFLEPNLTGMGSQDAPAPGDSGGGDSQEEAFKRAGGVVRPGPYIVGLNPPEVIVPHRKGDEDDASNVANGVNEDDLVKPTQGEIRDAAGEAGRRRLAELGLDIAFEISDPRVIEMIMQFAGEQIKLINTTTRNLLRATMSEGLRAGEDINLLSRRIRGVFAEARGKRSVLIARTETIRAMNAGQLAATIQAGFEGKQWLSTRDGQVRDTHASLDGQIRRVNQDFNSPSGASGPYPGNLGRADEDCNCRCTTLSVAKVDGKEDGSWPSNLDTEEKRTTYWKANERLRSQLERKVKRAFRKGFHTQEERVLATLRRVMDGRQQQ